LYIDDVTQSGTTAATFGGFGPSTYTGIRSDDVATTEWDGVIDELGIWDRVLSASEVTELYNSGSGFQYPFTEGAVDNAIFHGTNQ